jgi:transcription initiation factor TFIID TATA-box-binding protein
MIFKVLGDKSLSVKNFMIRNIVANGAIGGNLRLMNMACGDHNNFCTYEPELFPGLIYRMK